MIVKMVVPIWGALETRWGDRAFMAGRDDLKLKLSKCFVARSKFVIVDVARHGFVDERCGQTVAEQFSEVVDKMAQIGASFERDTRHVHAKQMGQWSDR
jgi:hypothetical protein